jgi:hypothetical protein
MPDTLSKDRDITSSVLDYGLLEFSIAPSSGVLIKYNFNLVLTIRIDCKDDYYTYKIFDIHFWPKSHLVNKIVYHANNPDYLIGLLNKKHLGLSQSFSMGRKKIKEYLTLTNDSIQACISSLNKAMTN